MVERWVNRGAIYNTFAFPIAQHDGQRPSIQALLNALRAAVIEPWINSEAICNTTYFSIAQQLFNTMAEGQVFNHRSTRFALL